MNNPHTTSLFFAFIGVVLLARPTSADETSAADPSADPPVEACPTVAGKSIKVLVDAGKAEARAARWACSRELLRSAYTKQESFDIAGNLGIVTHELAKERADVALYVEAATYLTAALRGFPVNGPAEQRAALREREDLCRAEVVSLDLSLTPNSACVVISGRDSGCGPFPHELFAPPGAVTISVKAPGYESAVKTLTGVRQGGRHAVTVDLSARSAPTPAVPIEVTADDASTTHGFPLWPAYASGALAIVAFGVGGGLWGAGEGEKSQAVALGDSAAAEAGTDNFCAPPVASSFQDECDEIAGLLTRTDEFQDAAVGVFVAGGGLALGAGALALTHFLAEGEATTGLWVMPVVGSDGTLGVTAGGTF